VYITIKEIIKRNKVTFLKGKEVSPEVYTIVNEIESILNKEIVDWAKNCLNSKDPWFKFKRESICDTGLFLQKKRYVTKIIDNEGKQEVKVKYTGVEVNRTSMPATIKPFAKRIIETMLTTQSRSETNKVLEEAYEAFKKLGPQDVSFVQILQPKGHASQVLLVLFQY
jgi:DNA polymerase elongation subunit (family B)